MSKLKYLLMVFFLCLGCTRQCAVNQGQPNAAVHAGGIIGLKAVGVIGEANLGTALLHQPTGITVDPMGNVFIADTGNDRVVKCDQEGRFLAEAGGFGWGDGQFNHPTYLDTDNGLNLYVVDAQNKRIQRLDQNLNFVSVIDFDLEGDFPGLGLPQGIAVTYSGEIFVSDTEDDRVIKLDGFLEYERSFGGFAQEGGGLRDPQGLCVGRNGEVYVADSQNDRVVVFDSFGNVLRSIGEEILQQPAGVAVDQEGQVYVANAGANTLVVFGTDGEVVTEYGSFAPGMASLSKPTDLQLDRGRRLLVVDSGNNRILVFDLVK